MAQSKVQEPMLLNTMPFPASMKKTGDIVQNWREIGIAFVYEKEGVLQDIIIVDYHSSCCKVIPMKMFNASILMSHLESISAEYGGVEKVYLLHKKRNCPLKYEQFKIQLQQLSEAQVETQRFSPGILREVEITLKNNEKEKTGDTDYGTSKKNHIPGISEYSTCGSKEAGISRMNFEQHFSEDTHDLQEITGDAVCSCTSEKKTYAEVTAAVRKPMTSKEYSTLMKVVDNLLEENKNLKLKRKNLESDKQQSHYQEYGDASSKLSVTSSKRKKSSSKKIICWHFLRNRCQFGENCRYSHKREMCKYYLEKRCWFGRRCWSLHNHPDFSVTKEFDEMVEVEDPTEAVEEAAKSVKEIGTEVFKATNAIEGVNKDVTNIDTASETEAATEAVKEISTESFDEEFLAEAEDSLDCGVPGKTEYSEIEKHSQDENIESQERKSGVNRDYEGFGEVAETCDRASENETDLKQEASATQNVEGTNLRNMDDQASEIIDERLYAEEASGIEVETDVDAAVEEFDFAQYIRSKLKERGDTEEEVKPEERGCAKVYMDTFPTKTEKCEVCNKPSTLKCTRCKWIYYCCKQHQLDDWKKHRSLCKQMSPCGFRILEEPAEEKKKN